MSYFLNGHGPSEILYSYYIVTSRTWYIMLRILRHTWTH